MRARRDCQIQTAQGMHWMNVAPSPNEKFVLTSSRGFSSWLARTGGSLAFTTYQAGKLFLLGLRSDGRTWVHERTFQRCMGLAISQNARVLLMAIQNQLIRFDNSLAEARLSPDGSDAVYVPRTYWITGDLDVHDVAFGVTNGHAKLASVRPIFISTQFGSRRFQKGTALNLSGARLLFPDWFRMIGVISTVLQSIKASRGK